MKRVTILINFIGSFAAIYFVGYASEWQARGAFSALVVLWNFLPGILNAALTTVAASRVGGALRHLGASICAVLSLLISYFEGLVRSPDAQNAILLLVIPRLQLVLTLLVFVRISFLPICQKPACDE